MVLPSEVPPAPPKAIIGVIVSEFVASQEGIGYLIKLAGGLPVSELARRVGTSYMTAKTHCDELADAGYLIRTRLPRTVSISIETIGELPHDVRDAIAAADPDFIHLKAFDLPECKQLLRDKQLSDQEPWGAQDGMKL